MSLREMSDRESLMFKRNSDFEGSNIKRMRLDDDDDVLRSPTRTLSSSSYSFSSLAYSVSDFSAAVSEEDDDHRSSSISSGCWNSETKGIVTNTRLPCIDLKFKAHKISETEISTLYTDSFRKQEESTVSETMGERAAEMDSATKTERSEERKPEKKSPTQAELDDFFSEAERFEQKRFREKYNYDVGNDTPLEGRYQWVILKP